MYNKTGIWTLTHYWACGKRYWTRC